MVAAAKTVGVFCLGCGLPTRDVAVAVRLGSGVAVIVGCKVAVVEGRVTV